MSRRVLLVDDEPNVLAGYKRQLRKDFVIETAESGAAGLECLVGGDPIAVVVSDMRMPGMDGIQFLSEVRRHVPDTVRIMLTGNADVQTCIDAVNEGHIFRFLNKPCPPESLAKALQAGIEQYQLQVAERELIHGTLAGCIRTLTDILSLMNPRAFSRGTRIRRYVRHISAQLNSRHFWEYEMAATLSQIGQVALPPEILARLTENRSLTSEQRALFNKHPMYGCQLLSEIPRLEIVAQIVGQQSSVARVPCALKPDMNEEDTIRFGAQVLRAAIDADEAVTRTRSYIEGLSKLYEVYGPDHPLMEALMSYETMNQDRVVMSVTAQELSSGMVAAADIVSSAGHVLLTKGQSITGPVRMHLLSCAEVGGLKEPFEVEVVSE